MFVIVLVGWIYSSYYIKVPPDKVAIFSGSKGKPAVVMGGGRLRKPLVERVDYMSLQPFELPIKVQSVPSSEGVQVDVDAIAMVRFGSDEVLIQTAIQRFLSSDREKINRSILEILSGHLRSICSKMKVEEIISGREVLVKQVAEEAVPDLSKIGMELDVFTIQHINDQNGYLDALGVGRTAEVKRDADIRKAEAERDAKVKSALAKQEGEVAQAQADAAIAEAERERDIRIQKAKADVEAEAARAAQAGPLAEKQAQKAVVMAEVEVEKAQVQAEIEVERQRALREEQAQEAAVIIPARAKQEATVLTAEGEKKATIARAEADSQAAILAGQGAAESRTLQAAAHRAELEAQAEGNKAMLVGEAEGKNQLADALGKYNEAAMALEVAPRLIEKLPEIVAAASAPLGNIDRVVMLDSGSGNGASPMDNFLRSGTRGLVQAGEVAKEILGIDLSQIFSGKVTSGDRVRTGAKTAVDEAASSVSDEAPKTDS